jgi:hypothetical protein
LAQAGPALAEARSLIDTPNGRHAVTYNPDWFSTLPRTIVATREAAILLRFDALARAQAGDADGAVRSAHALFNAGASIGDEPSLRAQVNRWANEWNAADLLERALAQSEPAEGALAAVQARLEAAEAERLYLYAVRGERAGGDRFLENVRNGTAPTGAGAFGVAAGVPGAPAAFFEVPGFVMMQQVAFLHFMNEMVELAKLPPEEWPGALDRQRAKVTELPVLVREMVRASINSSVPFQWHHATLRCAIIMLAAERYRRAHGRWPATPDELVKGGLLKAVPGDPFAAGRPIKFAKRTDGLTVYSVGQNGVDDGGDLTKDANGLSADQGFRLWDVAARRQPPLPPKPVP